MIIEISRVTNGYLVIPTQGQSRETYVIEENQDAEAEAQKMGFAVLRLLTESPNESK